MKTYEKYLNEEDRKIEFMDISAKFKKPLDHKAYKEIEKNIEKLIKKNFTSFSAVDFDFRYGRSKR